MVSRTERQKICIKRWLAAGGQNSIVAATGFGKTRVALTAIEMLITVPINTFTRPGNSLKYVTIPKVMPDIYAKMQNFDLKDFLNIPTK